MNIIVKSMILGTTTKYTRIDGKVKGHGVKTDAKHFIKADDGLFAGLEQNEEKRKAYFLSEALDNFKL